MLADMWAGQAEGIKSVDKSYEKLKREDRLDTVSLAVPNCCPVLGFLLCASP